MSYAICYPILASAANDTNDSAAGICPKCYMQYHRRHDAYHCGSCGDAGWHIDVDTLNDYIVNHLPNSF